MAGHDGHLLLDISGVRAGSGHALELSWRGFEGRIPPEALLAQASCVCSVATIVGETLGGASQGNFDNEDELA